MLIYFNRLPLIILFLSFNALAAEPVVDFKAIAKSVIHAGQAAVHAVDAKISSIAEITSEKLSATGVAGEVSKVKGAVIKSAEAANQAARDLTVQTKAAEAVAKARDVHGSQGVLDPECIEPESAAGLKVGVNVNKKLLADSQKNFQHYQKAFKNDETVDKVSVKLKEIGVTGDDLHPASGTKTREQFIKSQKVIQVVMDPEPAIQIKNKYKTTPNGQQYEALQERRRLSLLTAVNVRNKVDIDSAPTLPLSKWADKTQQDAGEEAKAGDGEYISLITFLDLRSRKIADPNWVIASNSEDSDIQIQRKILNQLAVQTYIQNEQLHYLRGIAALLAEQRAQEVGLKYEQTLKSVHDATTSSN